MSSPPYPLPVFHTPLPLLHNPPLEILSGQTQPYVESPERYHRILNTLQSSLRFVEHELMWTRDDVVTQELLEAVKAVHEEEYVDFLREVYDDWVKEGGAKLRTASHGNSETLLTLASRFKQEAALPETFLHRSLLLEPELDGQEQSKGSAIARIGRFSFDLSAPVTSETYVCALASARLAISALDYLISSPSTPGAFALCRPPGHHSSPNLCGGYCFLNNAAIAARSFQARSSSLASTSPAERPLVAILDVDYHHGNGTSKVFYDDPSVLYVSLHAEGDYPWYTGAVEERGGPNAKGANVNFPLPLGTGEEEYLKTLADAVETVKDWGAELLIVSLGVDTYVDDPLTDFRLTLSAYAKMGRLIAAAGVEKTLFLLEGGYCLDAIGKCVEGVLEGFQDGKR